MSADLSNSGLSDLSSLDVTSLSLPLSRLTLSNNHLTQLSHLRPFISLEELHVENNEITNLTDGVDGIALLTQLKVLVLAGNKLKEIQGLENLKALQYLDISNNQISRLDGLSSNTSLAYLDASHNNITELSDLSKLTSLQTLNLDDNMMSSLLTAVNHLPASLTVLSLAGNQFSQLHNFTFLTKLEQLSTLDVSNNPFLEESYQQKYDFRPFLLFLLPRLTDLAGRVVSTQEWQLSQTLFTDSSGSFDNDLIELLRPDRSSGLIQYLIQRCPLSDVEVAQRRAADAKQAAQQAQEQRPTLGKKQPSIEVAKHQPRGVDRTEDADADAADNDIDAILARAQTQTQAQASTSTSTTAGTSVGNNTLKVRGSQSLLSPSSKQLEKERSKMSTYPSSLSDNSGIDVAEYHAMQKMVHDLTRYMKLVMRKVGDLDESKGEQVENPTVAELMLDLQETKAALIATQEKVMHQDNAIRVLWEEVRRLRLDSTSTSSSGTGTAATPTQFNTPMFRPHYPLSAGGADGDDPNLPFMPSVVSFSDGRQELSINNNSSPEASKRHSRAPSYTYQFPSSAVPQVPGSSNLSTINAMALQHAVQSYAHSPAGAPTPQSTPVARPLAASVGAAPSPMHSRNVSYTFPNMAPAQGQTGVLSHMSQAAMAAALAGLAQQQGGNTGSSSGSGVVSHTPPPSPFVSAGTGMAPTFNYGSLHVGSANSTAPPTPAQTPSQHHSFSFPSTAAPSPVVGASQSFGFPPPSPQFLSMSYPAGSAPSPSPPPTPSFGPSLAQAPDREKGSLHTPPTTPAAHQSFVWPSPRSSITALTAQLPPNINQPGAYAAPTPTARSSLSVNVGQGSTPFVPSPSPSPLINPAPTPMPTPSHSGLHPHGRSTSFSSLPSLNSLSGLSPSPSLNSLQQGQFMIMLTPTNASSALDEQGQLVGTQDFWSASPRSSISSSASSPPFASPRTSLSINTVTGTSGPIDFNGAESPAHAMNNTILGSSSGLPPPHGHHQHNNSLSSFPTINPSFSFLPPTHPPSTPVQAPTPASTPIHTGLSGHPRAPQNTPTAQSGSFNYPHSRAPSLSSIPSFSPLLQSPAGSAPSSTPNTPTFTSSHPFRFHHSPTLPTIDAHSTLHHSLSNQFISQSPSSGRHISFDSNDSEDEEPQARQRQQALLKDAVHQALGHGHKSQKSTSTIVENEAEDEHDTFNTDRINKPTKDERESEEDVLSMPRVSVRTQSFESIASPLHGPSPVTASPLLKSNGGRQ